MEWIGLSTYGNSITLSSISLWEIQDDDTNEEE